MAEKGRKGIALGIFGAVGAALITYCVSLIDQHRKQKIDFVNNQIEKLYGPLLVMSRSNGLAWVDIRRFRGSTTYYFSDNRDEPSPEQVEIWRRWMKSVFMPFNLRMEEAILNNSQLIVGNEIHPVFHDFISHVEGYKAIVAKWKDSDDIMNDSSFRKSALNVSVSNYPETFDECVTIIHSQLIEHRNKLQETWLPSELFDSYVINIPDACKASRFRQVAEPANRNMPSNPRAGMGCSSNGFCSGR